MIKRWMIKDVASAMAVRRGVNLTGARQVGKSTLTEMLDLPHAKRFTFDDKFVRAAAQSDPYGFVKHLDGQCLVIDEVQKVSDVLDGIKMILDHDHSPGQYLLTGSSSIRFAHQVKDSLAGRLRTIRLRSLAYGEIMGSEPTFLDRAFSREFPASYPDLDKRSVLHVAFKGGYPESLEYDPVERRNWYHDYLTDILTKDVGDSPLNTSSTLPLISDGQMFLIRIHSICIMGSLTSIRRMQSRISVTFAGTSSTSSAVTSPRTQTLPFGLFIASIAVSTLA